MVGQEQGTLIFFKPGEKEMKKGLIEDIIFTLKISFGTALLIGTFFYFLFQRPDLMRNFGYESIKGSASPIIHVSYDNPDSSQDIQRT